MDMYPHFDRNNGISAPNTNPILKIRTLFFHFTNNRQLTFYTVARFDVLCHVIKETDYSKSCFAINKSFLI